MAHDLPKQTQFQHQVFDEIMREHYINPIHNNATGQKVVVQIIERVGIEIYGEEAWRSSFAKDLDSTGAVILKHLLG